MRFLNRVCCCFALIVVLIFLMPHPSEGQQNGNTANAKKEKPLTLGQVIGMLRSGVSTLDLLAEARIRSLDFEVGPKVLAELEKEFASRHLLNNISDHSLFTVPANWEPIDKLNAEKKWPQLIEQLNYLLGKNPRCVGMINLRATAYLQTGRMESAIADYQTASQFDPDNLLFTLNLARAYLRGGDARKAAFHATTVIDDRVFSLPEAFLIRGRAFTQLRRHRDAIQDLQTAIQMMPTDAESHLELARLLIFCPDESLRSKTASAELLKVAESLSKGVANPSDLPSRLSIQAALEAAENRFEVAIATLEKIPGDGRIPEFDEQLAKYRERQLWLLPAGESGDAYIPNVGAFVASRMVRVIGGGLPKYEGKDVVIKPFLLGKFEVTNLEWSAVMGHTLVGRPMEPRDFVNMNDAKEFISRLNTIVGQSVFRLPTEDEWELATRAGVRSRYYFGDNTSELAEHAWFERNSGSRLHDVGKLKESPLGFFDLYGNVAEWCVSSGPAGDGADDFGILKGGTAFNSDRFCDSTARIVSPVRDRRRGAGIRVAADPVPILEKLISLDKVPKSGLDAAISDSEQRLGASNNVAADQQRLAMLYYVRGCLRVAEKKHNEAISDFTAVLRQSAGTTQDWRSLVFLTRCQRAWLFATSDTPSVRNLRQAREDAEMASIACDYAHWAPHAILAAVAAAEGAFDKAEERELRALPLTERPKEPWCGAEFAEASRLRMKKYKAREAIVTGELLIPLSAVSR